MGAMPLHAPPRGYGPDSITGGYASRPSDRGGRGLAPFFGPALKMKSDEGACAKQTIHVRVLSFDPLSNLYFVRNKLTNT